MPDEATLKEILKQQNVFLQQQQKWMEEMLAKSYIGADKKEGFTVPAFQRFNKDVQSWEAYLEQLEQHFSAYAVCSAEKKKSFFISWCGAEVFELLKNLCGTVSLEQQTFEELTSKLTDHFKTKKHVVAARYNFFKSEMKVSQTYREWIADMRGLARDCEFVCTNDKCQSKFIDEMIRDQIIVKTPHEAVRSAALQKLKPSLQDIILIAESFENAMKTVEIINDKVPINAINQKMHQTNEKKFKACSGCGSSHKRENCKFLKSECYNCGKLGHIAAVCLSKNNRNRGEFKKNSTKNKQHKNHHNKRTQIKESIDTIYNVTGIISEEQNKTFIKVEICNKIINFQMDCGATASVINFKTYLSLNSPKLIKSNRILYGFGKNEIPVLGEIIVSAKCGQQIREITLVVVNLKETNNLFGNDLFKTFNFEVQQINEVVEGSKDKINEIFEKYKDIFEPGLGKVSNFLASISLKAEASPKFFRSRSMPFAQLQKFKAEAERMVEAGIWRQIKFSNWASPIVITPKADGGMRICGDFKQAVNAQLNVEQYPLPNRDTIFHTISRGQYFSKIDLKEAYLQMELDDESKAVMVVNTPLGLFQYLRLPYGIASAPAIFQRYLEQLLVDIEGCANYLDDIIISGATVEEHNQRLQKVLEKLQENGIKCKTEKCVFLKTELQYLGRKISAAGILPDDSGVEAVKKMLPPKNLKQIEAFIGKVNYYHNFIPNFSQLAAPLNILRRKGERFRWGTEQKVAFEELKKHLVNAAQLTHFRDDLPIILATDASSFGIGAVISHKMPDGGEKPIAFASKTLDRHQIKYSQIEKEALSIIFGIRRFHQYLYGRKFILITDHKPLVSIFDPMKHLPEMTSHRLQRWALILMAYQFEIVYRKTTDHGNADALSRLPLGSDDQFDKEESCLEIMEVTVPINAEIIKKYSIKDNILKKVYFHVSTGWTEKLPPQSELLPYFQKRWALTICNKMLCVGNGPVRVIIPNLLKHRILKLLHEGHWGTVKTKQLARQNVWWPNMDDEIEKLTKECRICMEANPAPAREFQNWPEATTPWERIHIDFAGPVFNSMWLIVVDAFSKFPFVIQLTSTTTSDTITALTSLFALEGLPKTIVSDNGPQLTADDFKKFCKQMGIEHITTAPFHPASNGLAERFVRTFKTAVRKNLDEGLSVKQAVTKFLFTNRALPNADGKSAAELLHGRPWRTLLTQIKENSGEQKEEKRTKFHIGQKVYIKNFSRGAKWVRARIKKTLGRMMYIVKNKQGEYKRHQNQVKADDSKEDEPLIWWPIEQDTTLQQPQATEPTYATEEESPEIVVRRGKRNRRAVDRFQVQN